MAVDQIVAQSPMSPAATTLPFLHDGEPAAGAACKRDILLYQNDGEVLDAIEAQNDLLDFFDDDGLNSLGRLVEQHDLRLGGQRARDGELLLLAAGQHAAAAIEILRSDRGTARARGPESPGFRRCRAKAPDQNVVANGEVGDDLAALRHVGKAGARPPERRLGARYRRSPNLIPPLARSVRPMMVLSSVVLPVPLRPSIVGDLDRPPPSS